MQYKATLGNVDWLNANEQKLRELFPETWTHLQNLTDVSILYRLKLHDVHLNQEHVADFIQFMHDSGALVRNDRLIRRSNEPTIFVNGFLSKMNEEDKTKEQPAAQANKTGYKVIRHDHSASLVMFILMFGWISGFVLAKGFWSTLFCFIPFWAWYLTIEKLFQHFGLI